MARAHIVTLVAVLIPETRIDEPVGIEITVHLLDDGGDPCLRVIPRAVNIALEGKAGDYTKSRAVEVYRQSTQKSESTNEQKVTA